MELSKPATGHKIGSVLLFPHGGPEHQPLGPQLQQYIKDSFWPQSQSSVAEYVSYFKYFQWMVGVVAWSDNTGNSEGHAIRTYEDLAMFVRFMTQNKDCRRGEIAEKLSSQRPDWTASQILRSIDLTARLWLTLHVRSNDFPTGPYLSDIAEAQWAYKSTFKEMALDCFPKISASSSRESRIDPSFTIVSLRKLCRINIQWTANLLDHLRYDRSKGTVHIYPHKVCLISHLESCDIIPKELISETLQTLDLLFPFSDKATQDYLDESSQPFYRTSHRNTASVSDFGEFHYWRKRLLELHDLYNQAPRSVAQMWHDRRNPMQWWTFWLAALIALLTIVFGIISSYTAFKQMGLAVKANQLSALQTCSQLDPLPAVCLEYLAD